MKTRSLVGVLAVVFVCLIAPKATAQSSSSEWQYTIAPYLWAAGMDGTMTIADNEADIDVPFSDIIENLDFALMGHFDMRNERWVLASDLIFVDVGHDEKVTGDDGLAEGTVTTGMDMTLFEVVGGYRVSPAVALLAGARWVDMGASLRYSGDIVGENADVSKDWIDPLVGVHVFAPLSEKWWLGARGDVGGFGVGSELTWQGYLDIGYRASASLSIILGYHALDIDYEGGSEPLYGNLDLMVSGPQLGVAFHF